MDDPVARDGYGCAIPGCTSRRSLQDHHVIFRSHGGGDADGNRLTVCAFHHQRCLHARLLRVTDRAPDALLFELGLRPGAPRSGDVELPPANAGALAYRRLGYTSAPASRSFAIFSASEIETSGGVFDRSEE